MAKNGQIHQYVSMSSTPPGLWDLHRSILQIRERRDDLGITLAEQSQAPCDIYAKLLLPIKHGYPLWLQDPDPGLSPAYRSAGVNIGDVGTITYDGGFDFFFNICYAADHPINCFGVPGGFVPLTVEPKDVFKRPEMHDKGTHISSAPISKALLKEEEYEYVAACSSNICPSLIRPIWIAARRQDFVGGSNLTAQVQRVPFWCYRKEGLVWIYEIKDNFLSMPRKMACHGISSLMVLLVVGFKTGHCALSLGVIRIPLGELPPTLIHLVILRCL